MDLTSLFEMISKYGWWSIIIALGIGLIYISVKLVASKITSGVRGGMDDIATKLTNTVATQLQEMSSTNSSSIRFASIYTLIWSAIAFKSAVGESSFTPIYTFCQPEPFTAQFQGQVQRNR